MLLLWIHLWAPTGSHSLDNCHLAWVGVDPCPQALLSQRATEKERVVEDVMAKERELRQLYTIRSVPVVPGSLVVLSISPLSWPRYLLFCFEVTVWGDAAGTRTIVVLVNWKKRCEGLTMRRRLGRFLLV